MLSEPTFNSLPSSCHSFNGQRFEGFLSYFLLALEKKKTTTTKKENILLLHGRLSATKTLRQDTCITITSALRVLQLPLVTFWSPLTTCFFVCLSFSARGSPFCCNARPCTPLRPARYHQRQVSSLLLVGTVHEPRTPHTRVCNSRVSQMSWKVALKGRRFVYRSDENLKQSRGWMLFFLPQTGSQTRRNCTLLFPLYMCSLTEATDGSPSGRKEERKTKKEGLRMYWGKTCVRWM